MTRLLSWFILVAVFGAFAGVVYHALRARVAAGKGMPEYSVFSEDRDGLAALAQLLRKLDWQPVTLTQPVQHSEQRQAKGCLLILAEPVAKAWLPGRDSDMSEVDVQGLLHWVERGNTLLFCCRRMTALHGAMNLLLENDARAGDDLTSEVVLGEGGGYTDEIDRLVVEWRDVLRGGSELPLWWLENDPGAVLVRHGKGRVIVVADPSILTLRGLRRGDNVRFVINVASLHAGDGRVYFDEYHHGLRSGGGFWGYLYFHRQQWTVPVIALVLAVAAWGVGVRLGRAVSSPPEKQADAVDYASALARIYERAGVQHLLVDTLCRDFLAALTRHLRLRRSVLPAEILAAWRKQHPQEVTGELEALLRAVSTLRGGTASQGQLLVWARSFDRFKTEVLRAG